MKRVMITGAVLSALSFATASMANEKEHDILILPDTYFPETTYLKPGDKVNFINVSGDTHTIIAANEEWTIGPLDIDEVHQMVVVPEIERTFHNANAINSDGTYAVTGDISFDDSPVE